MKLDAVAVTAKDITKAVAFYTALGFVFDEFKPDDEHVEAKTPHGPRLMIDSVDMIQGILGEVPKPGNHSSFALLFDSAEEVDAAVTKAKRVGGKVMKEPWDAFWGQRYAVIADPDGYMIDLFAYLKK